MELGTNNPFLEGLKAVFDHACAGKSLVKLLVKLHQRVRSMAQNALKCRTLAADCG